MQAKIEMFGGSRIVSVRYATVDAQEFASRQSLSEKCSGRVALDLPLPVARVQHPA